MYIGAGMTLADLGNSKIPGKFEQGADATKAAAATPSSIETPTGRRWIRAGVLLVMIASVGSGVFVFLAAGNVIETRGHLGESRTVE
jgi:hypothetical protein